MIKLAIRRFEKESVFDIDESYIINGQKYSEESGVSFFDFVSQALQSDRAFFEFSNTSSRFAVSVASVVYIIETEDRDEAELLYS